ncbi:hypothetical protein Tco_0373822 [Tanacetum coccineum]
MNSYTFMGIDLEGEEEVTSRKKTFIKRAIAFIKNRRRANRVTRNHITRDRYGAHDRLVAAFFSDEPMYGEVKFRKTFRMARPLFNEIVTAVIDHDPFFRNNFDCTRKEGIFGLLKCTSAIRQLTYDVHAEFLDEYMQICDISQMVPRGNASTGRPVTKRGTSATRYALDQISTSTSKPSTRFD